MTDKEIDNLVKQKLSQQTFEYNDAYWQKAAALIDADRANSSKLVWLKYAFYSGVLSIFLLMGWFLLENNKTNKYEANLAKPIENNVFGIPNSAAQIAPENNNANITSSSNNTDKSIAENTKSGSKIENESQLTQKLTAESFNIGNQTTEGINAENVEEIAKSTIDETTILDGKNINLFGINLTDPSFDFKNIGFVKSPENYHHNSSISTYLNASFEVGMNSFNQTFTSNSFGYYIGGRCYFDIGKLSFNTNIHFENINQNLAARNYTNKTYDFTSITLNTSIKNQSIDYAIIGLNALYPVYKNHSLGVGFQYAQIIESHDLMSVVNLENNTVTNSNTQGYSSVLNKNDWQLTFNYQYRFAKHFAANASYVYGLNDVTKNDALATNKEDNNRGLKIGLQYIIK